MTWGQGCAAREALLPCEQTALFRCRRHSREGEGNRPRPPLNKAGVGRQKLALGIEARRGETALAGSVLCTKARPAIAGRPYPGLFSSYL